MKNLALFSLKVKSKKLKFLQLQFLFGALRVKFNNFLFQQGKIRLNPLLAFTTASVSIYACLTYILKRDKADDNIYVCNI